MRLYKTLNNRKIILTLAILGILLIAKYLIFQVYYTTQDATTLLAETILRPYLNLAEWTANGILTIFFDGVSIRNHKIIFTNDSTFVIANKSLIDNWIRILMLRWTAILLFVFWLPNYSLKKKIRFTFFLFLTHFFMVVFGLVTLAGLGSLLDNSDQVFIFEPHLFGSVALFTLFAIWIKKSKSEIELGLSKLKIELILSEKKINEILVVFLMYILLVNLFIPYINHNFIIKFLLNTTKSFVFLFGYSAIIDGNFLTGPNGGSLFIGNGCLGYVTLFIFASLVYLTRRDNKTAWKYILFGVITLHLINIIRLSFLYIYAQHNSNAEQIKHHHDIYNIVIYLFILILWIIWFEKYAGLRKVAKKKHK